MIRLDSLHRGSIAIAEKHDIGLEQALEMMNHASLWLISDSQLANSYVRQAAFATAVNAGKRSFLGGVHCIIPDELPNLLPLPGKAFSDVIIELGGQLSESSKIPEEASKMYFGIVPNDPNSVEVVYSNWQGGINAFEGSRVMLSSANPKVPVGAIGAVAMGLFHLFVRRFQLIDTITYLGSGLSFWNPQSCDNWYTENNEGPEHILLPRRLWVIGLGHLGQAYLWMLSLLPYDDPPRCMICLQDHDIVDQGNLGAQILSESPNIGRPKARICAEHLESIGFKTRVLEKPFDSQDQQQGWSREYGIALTGLDNIAARRSIKDKLFRLWLDGGTNGSSNLFDSFTMKNFPAIGKPSTEVWPDLPDEQMTVHKNLRSRFEKEGRCGQLIDVGISTPFVGLYGGTIVISELLRALNRGKRCAVLTSTMRDPSATKLHSSGSYGQELLPYCL